MATLLMHGGSIVARATVRAKVVTTNTHTFLRHWAREGLRSRFQPVASRHAVIGHIYWKTRDLFRTPFAKPVRVRLVRG